MFIAGPVQAISASSITLGSPGRTVTAAITGATRVSGRVTSPSQIKVGDNVSAQITVRNGKSVVTSIQYPAQLPSGGGQP
jgi:Cu/Ag efflux protein CusF